MSKNSAPKGKGKVKKPTTISRKTKIPLVTRPKKNLITIEAALNFLQSKGHPITEEVVNQITELSRTPTDYDGKAGDQSRQLKRLMLQALEKTLGVVTTAAKLAGIHRGTHHRWVEEDEEYRDCVQNLNDVALDFSEAALHEMIRDRVPAAVIFHLKTKGKKRGYIETVHNMNQSFDDNNVHYYIPDNGRDGMVEDAKLLTE